MAESREKCQKLVTYFVECESRNSRVNMNKLKIISFIKEMGQADLRVSLNGEDLEEMECFTYYKSVSGSR